MSARMAAAALALTACAAAAAPGKFTVAYKATAPLEYGVFSVERLSPAAKQPAWKFIEVTQRVRQQATAAPDGNLSVAAEVLGESVHYDGRRAEPAEGEEPQRAFGWGITPRGERLDTPGFAEPTAAIDPVLPAGAIAPGHAWTVDTRIPPDVAVPMTVKQEFLGVLEEQGMPCAVVVTQGEAKGKDPKSGSACAFKGHGRYLISLTDGALVSASTFTSFAVKAPGAAAPLRRETKRDILRLPKQK